MLTSVPERKHSELVLAVAFRKKKLYNLKRNQSIMAERFRSEYKTFLSDWLKRHVGMIDI